MGKNHSKNAISDGKMLLCQTLKNCNFNNLAKKKKDYIFDTNELWLQAMNTEANVPIVLELWFWEEQSFRDGQMIKLHFPYTIYGK